MSISNYHVTTATANDDKAKAITTIRVLKAVAQAIHDAGSIPAGHLYAMLMTKGCTMEGFDLIVGYLTGTTLVENRGDLLVWVGER